MKLKATSLPSSLSIAGFSTVQGKWVQKDSKKQTEGCAKGGGWGDGVTGGWALRRACDVTSTGYYTDLMNH